MSKQFIARGNGTIQFANNIRLGFRVVLEHGGIQGGGLQRLAQIVAGGSEETGFTVTGLVGEIAGLLRFNSQGNGVDLGFMNVKAEQNHGEQVGNRYDLDNKG